VLIIRKSNCINTASGIVFSGSDRPVCGLRRNQFQLIQFDRPVCRLRRNQFLLNLHTGRSLTDSTIPDAVLIQFDLLMMSTEFFETCRGL